MNITVAMITHYTAGWTPQCINSFHEVFPHFRVIVFNNNPLPGQRVRFTRSGRGLNRRESVLGQEELKYLQNHRAVAQIVEVPRPEESLIRRLPSHGEVMDFMFSFLHEAGHERLLYIEPDCYFLSNEWFRSMQLIDKWVVGCGAFKKQGTGSLMQVCPTLWKIRHTVAFMKERKLSFKGDLQMNTGQRIMRRLFWDGFAGFAGSATADGIVHYKRGSKSLPVKLL